MPRNPDDYVGTGASIEDALRDLTPEQFDELMAELGRRRQGPAPAPAKKVPDLTSEERIEAIRSRIRNLLNQGYTLNAAGASDFTVGEMLQRRMLSYGAGLGAGTGRSAAALSERMKRGK